MPMCAGEDEWCGQRQAEQKEIAVAALRENAGSGARRCGSVSASLRAACSKLRATAERARPVVVAQQPGHCACGGIVKYLAGGQPRRPRTRRLKGTRAQQPLPVVLIEEDDLVADPSCQAPCQPGQPAAQAACCGPGASLKYWCRGNQSTRILAFQAMGSEMPEQSTCRRNQV